MLPLIMALVQAGLPMLANALASKGKDAIEAKTGLKLPDIQIGQSLTPEQIVAMKKIEVEHEEYLVNVAFEERKLEVQDDQEADKQVTARWTSDNSTDSWLAKNVRPVLMLALFSSLVLFATMSIPSVGQPIADKWIDLFQQLSQAAFYAYFGSRGIEKVTKHVADAFGKKDAK